MRRLLCWLLWRANTHVSLYRNEFYELKDRLLKKHGKLVGTDWQHIVHVCWSCGGTGVYDYLENGEDVTCYRCNRGIYAEFWVELERWEWCGRVFYRPKRKCLSPPMAPCEIIEGKIKHSEVKHHRESLLWLTLLTDRRLWWRIMRTSWERSRMPLSLLNRLVFWCRYRLGKIRTMSWGVDKDGRSTCGRSYDADDIPF